MIRRPAFSVTALLTLAILPTRALGVGRMAPVTLVLLMAVVVTVSTGDAAAERPVTYNPPAVEYIEEIIAEPGITKKTKTDGSGTWIVTTDVKLVSSGKYHVDTTIVFNDDESKQVSYEIQANEDGTYSIIIEDLASHETYTDVAEVLGGGSGRSDGKNAQITLSDRKYGPVGTRLSDSYTGCFATRGEFSAEVLSDIIVTSWRATPSYFHLCFLPAGFTYVDVREGGVTERYTGSNFRNWYHSFVGYHGVATWYIIDVNFYYGPLWSDI
ncbi:MAG: hypothetical protein D9C04_04110 [Nitrosopumilus sp. B06]|nr:MAG: hypothetical protein D9C04_04110 [Nitrosopumilus sp. B06]